MLTSLQNVTDSQAKQQQQLEDLKRQLEQTTYEATGAVAKETPTPVPSPTPMSMAQAEKRQQEAAKPETHVAKCPNFLVITTLGSSSRPPRRIRVSERLSDHPVALIQTDRPWARTNRHPIF